MATTVTSKGQVTIPRKIREAMGIRPGDRVIFYRTADDRFVVERETVDIRALRGSLRHDGAAVSVEEMNEAIAREATRDRS